MVTREQEDSCDRSTLALLAMWKSGLGVNRFSSFKEKLEIWVFM